VLKEKPRSGSSLRGGAGHSDKWRLVIMAKKKNSALADTALMCPIGGVLYGPLTATGRREQIRSLQKYRMKLVCEAFASEEPEAIFRYHELPPELDPKLIRRKLEAFIEWALSEPAGARKDNQVRDETIGLMVSTMLLDTKLRPTRNRASRAAGGSACSIVVEMLGEHGIHVSEDLVENAWKTWVKRCKQIGVFPGAMRATKQRGSNER
jgi:hypothetical protein